MLKSLSAEGEGVESPRSGPCTRAKPSLICRCYRVMTPAKSSGPAGHTNVQMFKTLRLKILTPYWKASFMVCQSQRPGPSSGLEIRRYVSLKGSIYTRRRQAGHGFDLHMQHRRCVLQGWRCGQVAFVIIRAMDKFFAVITIVWLMENTDVANQNAWW